MPLERPNYLELVGDGRSRDEVTSLDELLGTWDARPGELCAPFVQQVPTGLREVAARRGMSASLALSLLVEHALVLLDAGPVGHDRLADLLDARAAAPAGVPLTPALASYVRRLMGGLNTSQSASVMDDSAAVVPVRLLARARASWPIGLDYDDLERAMRWELAAVRDGRTMSEFALRALVGAGPLRGLAPGLAR
jgi:hypothetical protein